MRKKKKKVEDNAYRARAGLLEAIAFQNDSLILSQPRVLVTWNHAGPYSSTL